MCQRIGRRFLTSRYFAWGVQILRAVFGVSGVCHLVALAPGCMVGPMLRALGGRVDGSVNFTGPVRIVNAREDFRSLEIRGPAWLGTGILFDLTEEISIGAGASIGWDVKMFTHFNTGDHNELRRWFPATRAPLRIGPHCFISSQSLLFPGISLGARTMVGGSSIVRKSTPGDCVVMGSPARIIQRLGAQDAPASAQEGSPLDAVSRAGEDTDGGGVVSNPAAGPASF